MRKAINDWLRIAEARTISDCASSNRKSHDLITNSRFNVSHSAFTGGEPPGFRTARARSAFSLVPVFARSSGLSSRQHPGTWRREHGVTGVCAHPQSRLWWHPFESIRQTFPLLDFCRNASATRECEMVTFQENVNRSRPTGRFVLLQAAIARFFVVRRRFAFLLTVSCGRPKTSNNFVKCFYPECRIGGLRKWSDTEHLSRFLFSASSRKHRYWCYRDCNIALMTKNITRYWLRYFLLN